MLLPSPFLVKIGVAATILFITVRLLFKSHPTSTKILEKVSSPVYDVFSLQSPTYSDNLYDVKNETLGFQKIFVLSMPSRVDKRDVWTAAALYSNISVEYIDGVDGKEVPLKAYPAGWNMEDELGALGCYRGHMNFINKMVNERIQTALIFEDDADWDVMIKSQLVEYARGTRYLQGQEEDAYSKSPYGDDWDLLWLGHCGAKNRVDEDGKFYVIRDDPTVAPWSHRTNSNRWPNYSPAALQGDFTRAIYSPVRGLCSMGYALSLRGAEKMLYEFALRPQAIPWDRAMQHFCTYHMSDSKCFASHPTLTYSYRMPGNDSKDSDRSDWSGGNFRENGTTENLVFPVKPNIHQFLNRLPTIKSQWPGETLVDEIEYHSIQIPEGTREFVKKDEFVPIPA